MFFDNAKNVFHWVLWEMSTSALACAKMVLAKSAYVRRWVSLGLVFEEVGESGPGFPSLLFDKGPARQWLIQEPSENERVVKRLYLGLFKMGLNSWL